MSSVDSTDLCDEHITHSGPGAPRCEVGRRPMACADAVIRITRERASGERAVNSVVSRVVQLWSPFDALVQVLYNMYMYML